MNLLLLMNSIIKVQYPSLFLMRYVPISKRFSTIYILFYIVCLYILLTISSTLSSFFVIVFNILHIEDQGIAESLECKRFDKIYFVNFLHLLSLFSLFFISLLSLSPFSLSLFKPNLN